MHTNTTSQPRRLLREALKLSPVQRAGMAQKLLSSLDAPDPGIDRVWRAEIRRRIKEYELGKAETMSLHEVLSRYIVK